MIPSKVQASKPDCQVASNPAKKSGIGNRFTRKQIPYAIPMPIAPLMNAISSASMKNC